MDSNLPTEPQVTRDAAGLKPGEIFWNNYRVISIIGRGGVSAVYKAENINNKEIVAIKILQAKRLSDEELVKRFVREAQTTTRLDHPNAIHIYEWGIDQFERPFMIMENLQGETLAKRIDRTKGLNYKKAIEIMEQICAAMSEAHSLGIVHRDLKPENIMLVNHNGVEDWVKVFDFGIARRDSLGGDEENGRADTDLTRVGAILGTPLYMAPEQLRGRKADQRSDIYALGIIMYEMLTGKHPFASKNTAEIVVGHLNSMPEMPHKVRIDLGIPESVSQIVMRAIAKNAWERPTTVQEFSNVLVKAQAQSKQAEKSGASSYDTSSRLQPPVSLGGSMSSAGSMSNQPHLGQPHGQSQSNMGQSHMSQSHMSQPHMSQPHSSSDSSREVTRDHFWGAHDSGGGADPTRKVCPNCRAISSGSNFHYCLKCGAENTNRWLPYVEPSIKIKPTSSQGFRVVLAVLCVAIALIWVGFKNLSEPLDITGRYIAIFERPIFAKRKDFGPALTKRLRFSKMSVFFVQEGEHIRGFLNTDFGQDALNGWFVQKDSLTGQYEIYSIVKQPVGDLEIRMEGTSNRLFRSDNWLVHVTFVGRRIKDAEDVVSAELKRVGQ
jgi:serine/threonine protein kinase